MKEAVGQRVNVIAVSHVTGTWLINHDFCGDSNIPRARNFVNKYVFPKSDRVFAK
jgi:hypothetical protein